MPLMSKGIFSHVLAQIYMLLSNFISDILRLGRVVNSDRFTIKTFIGIAYFDFTKILTYCFTFSFFFTLTEIPICNTDISK